MQDRLPLNFPRPDGLVQGRSNKPGAHRLTRFADPGKFGDPGRPLADTCTGGGTCPVGLRISRRSPKGTDTSGSAISWTSQSSFLAWVSSTSNPELCPWDHSCASIAAI